MTGIIRTGRPKIRTAAQPHRPSLLRRTIIESPYAGPDDATIERNVRYAQMALTDSLARGEAPFASHLLYTGVLSDTVPEQRARGIAAGFSWMGVADLVAVYEDFGISPGMQQGIANAARLGLPVERRRIIL